MKIGFGQNLPSGRFFLLLWSKWSTYVPQGLLIHDISQVLAKRCSGRDNLWTFDSILGRWTDTCARLPKPINFPRFKTRGFRVKSSQFQLQFWILRLEYDFLGWHFFTRRHRSTPCLLNEKFVHLLWVLNWKICLVSFLLKASHFQTGDLMFDSRLRWGAVASKCGRCRQFLTSSIFRSTACRTRESLPVSTNSCAAGSFIPGGWALELELR
jgi:hypothetical protein